MVKTAIKIITIILLALLQISLVSALPFPLNNILIYIILLVIFIMLSNIDFSFIFLVLGFGIVLDMYSPYPFGMYTLALFLTTLSLNFLYQKMFSSISVISMATSGVLCIVLYNFYFTLLAYFAFLLNITSVSTSLDIIFFKNLFWQIMINLLILVGIHIIFYKKFQSLFITIKKENVF